MKFTPEDSVRILAERNLDVQTNYLRTRALAQLLAWAMFDQRPGKRVPKDATKPDADEAVRPKIRTVDAKQAGQIALGYLLDRYHSGPPEKDREAALLIERLFRKSGGFKACMGGWGAKGLLSHLQEVVCEIYYVHGVVDYMCRYAELTDEITKFNIGGAKQFVEHNDARRAGYGVSKISKIWEKYKNAAPYLYSAYPFIKRAAERKRSPAQVFSSVERFAADQERISRFLGQAAYAADILKGKARNVRVDDFVDIDRLKPTKVSFTRSELDIIESLGR